MIYDAAKVPTAKRHEVTYVAGLDLAQQEDASALACLRCQKAPDGSIRLALAHLDRWWGSYPQTHRHVIQTLSREQLAGRCILAVDATGVGLSFYETFRLDPQVRELMGDDRILPITITSGRQISRSGQFLHVGKHRLIAELHAALARGTLRIAGRLPLRDELFAELSAFEAQVRATGTLAMGNNPRLAKHDDLVLAVAMGVVAARAAFGELDDAYKGAASCGKIGVERHAAVGDFSFPSNRVLPGLCGRGRPSPPDVGPLLFSPFAGIISCDRGWQHAACSRPWLPPLLGACRFHPGGEVPGVYVLLPQPTNPWHELSA